MVIQIRGDEEQQQRRNSRSRMSITDAGSGNKRTGGRIATWYRTNHHHNKKKKERSRSVGGRRFGDELRQQQHQQYQHQPVVDFDEGIAVATGGSIRRRVVRAWTGGRSHSTGRSLSSSSSRSLSATAATTRALSVAELQQQQRNAQNHRKQQQQQESHPGNQQDVLATPAGAIVRDEYKAKKIIHLPPNSSGNNNNNGNNNSNNGNSRGGLPAVPPISGTRGSTDTATPMTAPRTQHVTVNKARRHTPSIKPPLQQQLLKDTALHTKLPPGQLQQGNLQREISGLESISQMSLQDRLVPIISSSLSSSLKQQQQHQKPPSQLHLTTGYHNHPPQQQSQQQRTRKPPPPQLLQREISGLESVSQMSLQDLHRLPPMYSGGPHHQQQQQQQPSGRLSGHLQLQREISGLDDHWGEDESTIASATLMHVVSKKDPSPNSVIPEDIPPSPTSSNDGESDQYFMMHNDHLLFRPTAATNVVDMLPQSFPARRRTNNNRFNKKKKTTQLPGEYFRSYGFSDDPQANKPKIRRRDTTSSSTDQQSMAGSTFYSTQSRSSICNVSTVSSARSAAFSISTGGTSHASCTTRSTQGSTLSTQSAPPNLWEVDRQLEKTKKQQNFEADTDLYKLPSSPSVRSCPGGGDNSASLSLFNTTTIATLSSRIPRGQSHWMNESMGVPNKVSISFRRLALRSQVRDLEDCLDESPCMAPEEKKHPPAPPLTTAVPAQFNPADAITPMQETNSIIIGKTKKKKKKKAQQQQVAVL